MGLFATVPIRAKSMVIEYCGRVRRWSSWYNDKKKYLYKGLTTNYTVGIGGSDSIPDPFVIDATLYGNNARFANHSHTPNCRLEEVSSICPLSVLI